MGWDAAEGVNSSLIDAQLEEWRERGFYQLFVLVIK